MTDIGLIKASQKGGGGRGVNALTPAISPINNGWI